MDDPDNISAYYILYDQILKKKCNYHQKGS